MKLTTKILFAVIVISFTSAAITSLFVYQTTKQVLETAITKNQLEITKETMDKLDRFLNEKLQHVRIIAADESIELALSDPVSIPDSQRDELILHTLSRLAALTGPWDDLDIISLDGTIITNDELHGKSVSDFPMIWKAYQKAIGGQVYYSDAIREKDDAYPTIVFAVPIRRDDTGLPIIGMVHAKLSWPILLEILDSVNFEKVHLYNSEGYLIGSNRSKDVKDFLREKDEMELISPEFFQKRLASTFVEEDDGEELITHARSLGFQDFPGNNWALHIETVTAKAFAPAVINALKLALLFIPIIFLSAILTLIVLRRLILTPLNSLSLFVENISHGNYDQQSEIRSNDEIGEVALALNSMAGQIRKSQQNLEAQVITRTHELDKKLIEMEKMNTLMIGREMKMIELKTELAKSREELAELKKENI